MFTALKNLSENAQRLLCIYAYSIMGGQKGLSDVKNLLHHYFNDFPADNNDAEIELERNGILIKKGYNWYRNLSTYEIPSNFFVLVLWYTLSERKDLAAAFKDMHLNSGIKYQYLRNSVFQLVQSNYTECKLASVLTQSDIERILPMARREEFLPLFGNLNQEVFEGFITKLVFQMIENDIRIRPEELERIYNCNVYISIIRKQKLIGYIELYNYIANGILPTHNIKNTDYAGLTLAAIHRVLTGKYEEAIKVFQAAMKINNKTTDKKNMYLVSLLNYYLMIAYAYEGSSESKTKLKQFLNKSVVSEHVELAPSRIIAEQALNIDKTWHPDTIKSIIYNYHDHRTSATPYHLAYLLKQYYELDKGKELDYLGYQKPNLLLLQHELSQYIDLTEEEKEFLKKTYGNMPGLTSVKHKADWELSLERLLNIGNKDEKDEKSKDVRIMYLYEKYNGSIEVREQSRLKNGEWGSGKSISLGKYRACELECMDEADRRIQKRFYNSNHYEMRLEHVVEDMVGESRLYTGRYAPFTLTKVTEEKPYIIVTRARDCFKVTSNVPKNKVNDNLIINIMSDEHISFIKIPENQNMIYRELLTTGSYPFEAESVLRKALAHIGASVEIHSELIEGGSTLPTIQGSSMACIQITPESDGYYKVKITSHPIVDGNSYFSLGTGDEKYIDEHEGKRVWVQRNLPEESKVANLFKAFFKEQEDNPDVDFYETATMLDSESNLEMDPFEMLTLLDFIQSNPETMYAEWPEGKKAKIKKMQKGETTWSGTLHEKGMWFQLEGEIKVDEETVLTMSQLLDLISTSKGRYVKLGEGEYLALSEKLKRQLQALEAVANREKGKIQISPFSAALLGDEAINGDIQIFMSNNLVQLRKKIMESANYKPEVPKALNADLRPYQLDGFQWMARLNSWGAGALLADDMGLGKTVQTIAFLLLKANEGASLVVAPASVAPNWKSELEKFAPSLNAIILNYADNRKKAIEDAGPNDIIITTYGILLSEQESINARKWNVACLDEAHIIKNRGAKTSAAAMKIQADNRVILTGTPVQNHLSELWSLFQFINPGLLGGYEVFSRKFITPIERDEDKECQKRLDKVVHPFMLRRTKNSVLQELPEKTEIYQNIELSSEEMAVYEVIRKKAEAMLASKDPDDKIDFSVLAEITRLRQASCSARLIEKNWKGECSKVNALVELLQEVIDGDNRALVFSQFTSFFDIVRETLDRLDIKYLYIDGSVPVSKRTTLVKQFQDGKCPIFLISLKAGGLGLNLTNANYVFHLDPWWNPAIEQQATDRAYRIGQKQAVTVYHLIAQNTIEEKIIRLHESKRTLAENILDGTDVSHKLTGKDLLEMVAK